MNNIKSNCKVKKHLSCLLSSKEDFQRESTLQLNFVDVWLLLAFHFCLSKTPQWLKRWDTSKATHQKAKPKNGIQTNPSRLSIKPWAEPLEIKKIMPLFCSLIRDTTKNNISIICPSGSRGVSGLPIMDLKILKNSWKQLKRKLSRCIAKLRHHQKPRSIWQSVIECLSFPHQARTKKGRSWNWFLIVRKELRKVSPFRRSKSTRNHVILQWNCRTKNSSWEPRSKPWKRCKLSLTTKTTWVMT